MKEYEEKLEEMSKEMNRIKGIVKWGSILFLIVISILVVYMALPN